MSQYVVTRTKTFTAGAAVAQHLRVKLSSGKLAVAGAAEQSIGTMEYASFADLDEVSVILKTAQGTRKMVASGAITVGDVVYGATGGKVSATANGNPEGIALETVTANNDVVEVMSSDVGDAALGIGGVASGYKIARGVTALDGSNPTPVVTGLTTVVAATVSLEGTAAPGVGTSNLTVASTNYATGALAVYAWKVTSSSDTTLIASTGTENFEWIAVGT